MRPLKQNDKVTGEYLLQTMYNNVQSVSKFMFLKNFKTKKEKRNN